MPAHKRSLHPLLARRTASVLRRGARLLRGLLATAVLAALLAGIPSGLARYVGWPLPRHLPTWPDIEAALLAPMSTSFLLHTLACILWSVWAAFVLEVARTTADELRAFPRPAVPHPGPLNALAAVLVGTIIMALIPERPAASATVAPGTVVTSTASTTASTQTPETAALIALTYSASDAVQPRRNGRAPRTVEVRLPRDGIYDSLWRIADRTLGDGSRWPEIYALNRDHPQPDGHSLTNPNLIRPGWILRLPDHPTDPDTHHPGHHKPIGPAPVNPRPPQTSSPSSSPSPANPSSSAPASSTPPAPALPRPTHDAHRQPGVSLPTGAFVGMGLAALITAALITVRRRRRVRYRPGSGDRDDLNIAPVVRALRLAYDDATRTDTPEPDGTDSAAKPSPALPGAAQPTSEEPDTPAPPSADRRPVIGVKNGQALAWDLVRTRGLGFIGPGALDAIRALLVFLLAERTRQHTIGPVEILIPASDARTLIGEPLGHPTGLRIVDDLDAALEAMEAELLTRTRTHSGPETERDTAEPPHGELVLVAAPAVHADRRLQAVLENGSTLGLAGILIGQWRPGATARVRPDGTVAASSPLAGEPLTGARLFTLPTDDAWALLDLLREARPAAPPPATPSPPMTPLRPPAPGRPRSGTEPSPSRPAPPRHRRRLASPFRLGRRLVRGNRENAFLTWDDEPC